MNKKGFTLIELLITMFVSMIILAGAVSLFSYQLKVYSGQTQNLNVIQDSRGAFDFVTRDIRMAGFKSNGSVLVSGITSANATTIRVLADLNQDNAITAGDEDVTISYNVDSKELSRNDVVLLPKVETFGFTYTLLDGSTTTTPADLSKIRRVKVVMVLFSEQLDPITKDYKRMSLSSEITPRNIK